MTEVPRQADRSWWLEEALAHPEFAGEPAPALDRDVTADVVIVGGGYTGMWTAWFLKEREPNLDIVLLEQDICGGGPSGRNGGFLNAFYDELGILVQRFGDEGRRTSELAARSIDEIGTWAGDQGIDIWYAPTGDLGISTSPAQDRRGRGRARGGQAARHRRRLPSPAARGRARALRLAGRAGRASTSRTRRTCSRRGSHAVYGARWSSAGCASSRAPPSPASPRNAG